MFSRSNKCTHERASFFESLLMFLCDRRVITLGRVLPAAEGGSSVAGGASMVAAESENPRRPAPDSIYRSDAIMFYWVFFCGGKGGR